MAMVDCIYDMLMPFRGFQDMFLPLRAILDVLLNNLLQFFDLSKGFA
jgi:hypothetical protein